MTYKQLKTWLESLDADELSRDVTIQFNKEYYSVAKYPSFADSEEYDLFDDGQLILRINTVEDEDGN
tara:strand:+ start:964 stop:1164 length:201 start_codon:yes stop_codon:yes gene_type:complete